jgi:2-methylcitrate dehydratase
VAVALLDGDVTLEQFKRRRFLDADVRSLLSKTVVRESKKYSRIYPEFLPNYVKVHLSNGRVAAREILLSKGYAGRAMTDAEIEAKFRRLLGNRWPAKRVNAFIDRVFHLERVGDLGKI